MNERYKFAIISLILIIVAVLAAIKILDSQIVAGALFSIIGYVTGQVVTSKLGGGPHGGPLKAILFFAVVGLTATGCAGWQTTAKATGDQLQQCMMRAAQQCAIEAVQQLTCPAPPPPPRAK